MIAGFQEAIIRVNTAFTYDAGSTGESMKSEALAKFNRAISIVKSCINTIQEYQTDPNVLPTGVLPPQVTQTQQQQVSFNSQVNALDQRYNLYVNMHFENRVPPAAKTKVANFLAGVGSNLTILKGYMDKKDTDLASIRGDLDKLIADVTAKLNYFKTAIIDKAPAQ
jgi:hypothetical protein